VFGVPCSSDHRLLERSEASTVPTGIVVPWSRGRGRLPVRALLEAKAAAFRIEEAPRCLREPDRADGARVPDAERAIFDSGYWNRRPTLAIARAIQHGGGGRRARVDGPAHGRPSP